uniref:Apple domain-containing protein n=1 Tax=Phaeomonas parva TaxID=124430 RepID=A0A7S1TP03_9STRA
MAPAERKERLTLPRCLGLAALGTAVIYLTSMMLMMNNGGDIAEGTSNAMRGAKSASAAAAMMRGDLVPQTLGERALEEARGVNCGWKPDEQLVGRCPKGVLYPTGAAYKDAAECAAGCCVLENCVTWQFRPDTGCLHGPDVRIGFEKEGTSKWCEADPPTPWQGQHTKLKPKEKIAESAKHKEACDEATWDPTELQTQCLGLGDMRRGEPSKSAANCRDACCADEKCDTWQWRADKGCFYNSKGFRCYERTSEHDFEPFQGQRKFLPDRDYSGIHHKFKDQGGKA